MSRPSSLPWLPIALALVGAAAIVASGGGWWLALAVAAVWIGTLFLVRPMAADAGSANQPSLPAPDVLEAIDAALEPLGIPLLLLERDRIVLANAAARHALGPHIVGQDARVALRHPGAMRLLDEGGEDSVTVPGFAGGRSLWQLTRRRIDARRSLLELVDRSAESDMGRAHTDFVANASHELRTPLAALIGYAETLSEGEVPADTRQRFLGTMLREARRMEALVVDLMSLSQVEAEKHDVPTETIDLAKAVERVAAEAGALAGKARIVLDLAGPALIRGDRAQIEQLARNLIENALKYGAPDQPVTVTLASTPRSLRLTIADRGAGIAPEHLPLLTRRFYRADPGRSRAAGGTGLGLAIVKHIAERHRARLDIASTLGAGTTVTVDFPPAPQSLS